MSDDQPVQRMLRIRLAISVALALVMAGVIVVALVRPGSGGESSAAAEANLHASGYAGSKLPDGFRVPAFSLTDQDGKRRSARSLGGRPSFITFTYSNCEDTCPLQVRLIRGALAELGRDVPAYAISVDPKNDTRASAVRFLAEQRVLGRVQFLLGTRRELAPVWKGFGVQPQENGLDHHARIVLADGQGLQRVGYSASDVTAKQLAADYARLERSSGR